MDATPLDALLPPPGAAPQNAPPLPSSTTYTPVVTPGTMHYSAPPSPGPPQATTYYVKSILRTIVQYIAVFLAAFGLSLPQVQSLGLRYVPNAYTAGGDPLLDRCRSGRCWRRDRLLHSPVLLGSYSCISRVYPGGWVSSNNVFNR